MQPKPIPPRGKKARMDQGLRRLITTVVLFFCVVAVSVLIAVLYPLSQEAIKRQESPSPSTPNIESGVVIREIVVEGNRHLPAENIILASGLRVGQNFMTVSRTAAEANILERCPYVKKVTITTPSYDSYHIQVEEKTAIGAMYEAGRWVILGEDLTSLGYLQITSDLPDRYLYIKGAKSSGKPLGQQALTRESADLLTTILETLKARQIDGINRIDISDQNDLSLEWNHQIVVKLGSVLQLSHKLEVFDSTLPIALANHGRQVRGTMDLSSYSDDTVIHQVIFTPNHVQKTTIPTTTTTTAAEDSSTNERPADDPE